MSEFAFIKDLEDLLGEPKQLLVEKTENDNEKPALSFKVDHEYYKATATLGYNSEEARDREFHNFKSDKLATFDVIKGVPGMIYEPGSEEKQD